MALFTISGATPEENDALAREIAKRLDRLAPSAQTAEIEAAVSAARKACGAKVDIPCMHDRPAPFSETGARLSWRRHQGMTTAHLFVGTSYKSQCSSVAREGSHAVAHSVAKCKRCVRSAAVDSRARARVTS